jgi:hypothetical protein
MVLNKTKQSGRVRVLTKDDGAKSGKDFDSVDMVLDFKAGESSKMVKITIHDDDNWEPDKDFYVLLVDATSKAELEGQDVKTRVTIIDDDKPGQIAFKETETIKCNADATEVEIVIVRKNGSDGTVKVDYETVEIDKSDHTASPNVDYTPVKGTLVFN